MVNPVGQNSSSIHHLLFTRPYVLNAQLQARFALPCVEFKGVSHSDARAGMYIFPESDFFSTAPPDGDKGALDSARHAHLQMALLEDTRLARYAKLARQKN